MLGLVLWLLLHASPTCVPAPTNPEGDTVILASYTYDALGRRVSTTIGDQTTHCVFDGQNVVAEYSPAGQPLREHFHGAQYLDERIATHEINTTDPSKDKFAYYLLKENFSVAAVGNADGSVIASLDYGATGNWEGVNTDFNHDDYVDGQDVLHLQGCITGPAQGAPAAGCTDADLDADGDVCAFRKFWPHFSGNSGHLAGGSHLTTRSVCARMDLSHSCQSRRG